jgi:hypothetical protein
MTQTRPIICASLHAIQHKGLTMCGGEHRIGTVLPDRRNPSLRRPGFRGRDTRGFLAGTLILTAGTIINPAFSYQQALSVKTFAYGRRCVQPTDRKSCAYARQGFVPEKAENGCTDTCSWIPETVNESKTQLKAKSGPVGPEDAQGVPPLCGRHQEHRSPATEYPASNGSRGGL